MEFAKVPAEPIKKPEIDQVLSRHKYFDHPANSEAVTLGWIDLSDRKSARVPYRYDASK